jgi:hypothetical protein
MNDWLIKSKNEFQEHIFDFLWNEWAILGVFASVEAKEKRIIDPEALLLFSLHLSRYDPRLFDEIIDWLFQNGQLINVQRLVQMQKQYAFACGPQLCAVAELLSKKATYKLKWSGVAKQHTLKNNIEPLFLDKEGTPLPAPQDKDADPDFLKHGLRRGRIHLRGNSQSFDLASPATLLLKLRSLIGIHARAEILCLLASVKEIHPSEAARITGYYQKTIQTTLVEMTRSGAVLIRTSKKEKYYRLKSGVLDPFFKPDGQSPQWINWPALLKAIETLWTTLCILSRIDIDPLLLSSELKKTLLSIYLYLHVEFDELLFDPNQPIEHIDNTFQRFLDSLGKKLVSYNTSDRTS